MGKKSYYEIINIWIDSMPKTKKVHDITDRDIAKLKAELNDNGIWVN